MNCINCFRKGHVFKDCAYPVTSYGIIGYYKFKEEYKIVLVQRKDTMGFIDFIRGKYDARIKKEEILEILVSEMTDSEKNRIIKYSFDELFKLLFKLFVMN